MSGRKNAMRLSAVAVVMAAGVSLQQSEESGRKDWDSWSKKSQVGQAYEACWAYTEWRPMECI